MGSRASQSVPAGRAGSRATEAPRYELDVAFLGRQPRRSLPDRRGPNRPDRSACSRPRPTRVVGPRRGADRPASRDGASRVTWDADSALRGHPQAARPASRAASSTGSAAGRARVAASGSQAAARRSPSSGCRHEAPAEPQGGSRSSGPASPAWSPRPSSTARGTTSTSSRPGGYPGGHTNTIDGRDRRRHAGRSTPASSSSTTATTRTSSACSTSSGSPPSRPT